MCITGARTIIDNEPEFLFQDEEAINQQPETDRRIDRKNIQKILDAFFSTRRGSGNTGLGLNLAYN